MQFKILFSVKKHHGVELQPLDTLGQLHQRPLRVRADFIVAKFGSMSLFVHIPVRG